MSLTTAGRCCYGWRSPMSDLPYLSIVVPAYNEAQRLPPTMTALAEFFREFTRSYEVLVVVEQSTDGTLEIAAGLAAQQAHFQVIDNGPQRGKGHAVITACLHALSWNGPACVASIKL